MLPERSGGSSHSVINLHHIAFHCQHRRFSSHTIHALGERILNVYPLFQKIATQRPAITTFLWDLLIPPSLKHVWLLYCNWTKCHQRCPEDISSCWICHQALFWTYPFWVCVAKCKWMRQLFDWRKPHFTVWLWIYDPAVPKRPFPPHGYTLHCAAVCGLPSIVKVLALEPPQDVSSRSFNDKLGPLCLVSQEGHVDIAQILVEHNTDAAAHE